MLDEVRSSGKELGRWVVQGFAAQAGRKQDIGTSHNGVAAGLSGEQYSSKDGMSKVHRVMRSRRQHDREAQWTQSQTPAAVCGQMRRRKIAREWERLRIGGRRVASDQKSRPHLARKLKETMDTAAEKD